MAETEKTGRTAVKAVIHFVAIALGVVVYLKWHQEIGEINGIILGIVAAVMADLVWQLVWRWKSKKR
jgi:hypothetical protein